MNKIIPVPFSARTIKERFYQIGYFSFGHNHKHKPPNARINRAGRIISSLQASRMKGKLIPLRLNEMLDRALNAPFDAAFVFLSLTTQAVAALFFVKRV